MTPEQFYEVANQVWAAFARRAGWPARIEREDAVQEAVTKCWENRKNHDASRSSERTYFSMVARHAITNKTQRKRPARIIDVLGADIYMITSEADGPPEQAMLQEQNAKLHAQLNRLPREWSDIVLGNASGTLSLSTSAVSKKYRKAIKRLRYFYGVR